MNRSTVITRPTDEMNYVIVSQKTMKANTYNIIVIELTTKHFVYNYEKFQLWETMIRGFLI